jgi:hypothetical protein
MASPPAPSTAHDFDFWVGHWDVFDPDGNEVGRSSITALFGTGAINEHWRGSSGVEGRSLSAYDPARGCWHQTWVDSSGTLLRLDGGMLGGAMVLQGQAPAAADPSRTERQRISWQPSADGSEVRQLWEVSADGAATWQVVFDGRYRRRLGA